MSNWTWHSFHRDGTSLAYVKQGQGAPLLLLHGITDSGTCWGRTADALATKYTVYALDQRAHGKSDAPAQGYTYTDFILDAVALLRQNEPARAVVMGHSFGAMVALALTAGYPDLVSKLVLVDPPLFDVDPNLPSETSDAVRYQFYGWLRKLKQQSKDEMIAYCRDASPHWSDDEIEAWAQSKLDARARLWEKDGSPMRGEWREWAREIACPTLLIYGEPARGGIVDDDRASEFLGLMHNGQAMQITNAGHSVHRDEFDHFMAAIRPFVAL